MPQVLHESWAGALRAGRLRVGGLSTPVKETLYIAAALAAIIGAVATVWALMASPGTVAGDKNVVIGGPVGGDVTVFHGPSAEQVARIILKVQEQEREARKHAEAKTALAAQLADKDKALAELTRAVEALRAEETAGRAQRAEAEAALQRGETEQADRLFAAVEEREAAQGAAHRARAAQAAKHRGAIAYMNRPREALAHYRRALDHAPEDADAWNQVGILEYRLGALAAAEEAWEKARALAERAGERATVVAALGNLGLVAETRGELARAEEFHKRALALDEALGYKEGMAGALNNLGVVALARGDAAGAAGYFRRALALFRQVGAARKIERVERSLEAIEEREGG